MPTPNINQEYIAVSMLPPSKRVSVKTGLKLNKWIAMIKGISAANIWLYDIFYKFMNGSSYVTFSLLDTYNKGDRVQNSLGVYESLTSGNIGNPLTDTNNWYKLLNNFIGANIRATFNFQRIVLEKGLNLEFNCTFRQPTSYSGTGQLPLSDIYITEDNLTQFSIVCYPAITNTNSLFLTPSGYYSFDSLRLGVASTYKFVVNIPVAKYTDIDANSTIAEKIVRTFVDRYRFIGVQYRIQTY